MTATHDSIMDTDNIVALNLFYVYNDFRHEGGNMNTQRKTTEVHERSTVGTLTSNVTHQVGFR